MKKILHYFAYGANINPKVLQHECAVSPLNSRATYLNDYALTFNVPGIKILEPAFANLAQCDHSQVWGVCYRLYCSDFEKICATQSRAYKIIDVPVHTKEGGELINAVTLISESIVISCKKAQLPSKHYLDLIIAGATHHHLPDKYICSLAKTKHFYFPIFSDIFNLVLKIAKPVYFSLQRS